MIKQWGDLTVLEKVKRGLLAEEGLVCMQCGKSVSKIVYWCADCQLQHERECATDIHEIRSYGENHEHSDDHGEEHIQVVETATGKLLDEFDTVSIHDVPTPERLQAILDWARENY